MDAFPILDISSDDELGFDEFSTVDNFDWISKLLEDCPVEDDDNFNGGVVDDDSDDVVVVGEVLPKLKGAKLSVPRCGGGDDDDCVVLDCDPSKSPTAAVKHSDGDSDDLLIVGEKGQIACRDYPHSRHLCAKFPFSSTPHESCCDLCHCYVCDSPAPCAFWGSGVSSSDHCHATDKKEHWQNERKRVRQSKNTTVPVTKLPAATVVRRPRSQQIYVQAHPRTQVSLQTHQVPRQASACRARSQFGLPNIISQGRNQRASIAVARDRFQSHLVSRQLARSYHSNTQSSRGSNLAPSLFSSRPTFKRSIARPVGANQSLYSPPNNVSMAYLQQMTSHQLARKPIEDNSITLTESSPHLNVNVSSYQTASNLSAGGFSPQLPGYGQPNAHVLTSHFQGCVTPAAVTSDSPHVYASVNQTQNVCSPSTLCDSSGALSRVALSEQPSVVTEDLSDAWLPCDTVNVSSCITERSQQHPEPAHNFCYPSFLYSSSDSQNSQVQGTTHQTSNSLNSIAHSGQQTSAENAQVQGVVPMHELLSTTELKQQLFDSTNSSKLDIDISSWLSDNEPLLGAQEGSYLCDMDNQSSVTTPVDAGMLYFDFETSWNGLAHP